jgi:hypothetical protein
LFKKYFNNGFKITRIYLLDPNVMNNNTKPYDVYTSMPINISNENNDESNETINEKKQWKEN